MRTIPTEVKDRIAPLYLSGMSSDMVAKELSISSPTVLMNLRENGISPRCRRYRHVDHDFFKEIDTEVKAYWLGYLSADGTIRKQLTAFAVCCKESDAGHIQKMLNDMKADYPLQYSHQESNPTASVEVSSVVLVRHLLNLGLTPRKAFTIKPCCLVPHSLTRHYWRGLFDGDGFISIKLSLSDEPGCGCGLAGNEYMVRALDNYIFNITGFRGTLTLVKDGTCRVAWQSREKGLTVTSILYTDAIVYLERKYRLWQRLVAEITSKETLVDVIDGVPIRRPLVTTKTCRVCNIEKPFSEFYERPNGKRPYSCKQCERDGARFRGIKKRREEKAIRNGVITQYTQGL